MLKSRTPVLPLYLAPCQFFDFAVSFQYCSSIFIFDGNAVNTIDLLYPHVLRKCYNEFDFSST